MNNKKIKTIALQGLTMNLNMRIGLFDIYNVERDDNGREKQQDDENVPDPVSRKVASKFCKIYHHRGKQEFQQKQSHRVPW